MVEDHTNWPLFRMLEVRAPLTDSGSREFLSYSFRSCITRLTIHGPSGSRRAVSQIHIGTVIVCGVAIWNGVTLR